jgi:hypothetical protein
LCPEDRLFAPFFAALAIFKVFIFNGLQIYFYRKNDSNSFILCYLTPIFSAISWGGVRTDQLPARGRDRSAYFHSTRTGEIIGKPMGANRPSAAAKELIRKSCSI